MLQLFRFKRERAGNLPPLPGVFPDYMMAANPRFQVGGAEGDRTPDLLIANEALSQLSYGP
jgi:hypothetical protein